MNVVYVCFHIVITVLNKRFLDGWNHADNRNFAYLFNHIDIILLHHIWRLWHLVDDDSSDRNVLGLSIRNRHYCMINASEVRLCNDKQWYLYIFNKVSHHIRFLVLIDERNG